jgi:glycine betaine/choline ABC-type transport system substrate-binding protein
MFRVGLCRGHPWWADSTAVSPRAELQDPNRIVVGAKTFTDQHILAELVSHQLRQHGFKVKSNPGMGSQILFDELANNAIDCYIDYSGTIWTNVMKRSDFPDRREMVVQMKRFLARNYGIVTVGRLGFENTYALAIIHPLQPDDSAGIWSQTPYSRKSACNPAFAFAELDFCRF